MRTDFGLPLHFYRKLRQIFQPLICLVLIVYKMGNVLGSCQKITRTTLIPFCCHSNHTNDLPSSFVVRFSYIGECYEAEVLLAHFPLDPFLEKETKSILLIFEFSGF